MNQASKPVVGSIADRVEREQQMQIVRDEEDIQALLPDKGPSPERRRYPESEFRRHFLPVFSGEAAKRLPEGYTPEKLRSDASNYWMRIAGSPNAEVDVIDSRGKVAFTVPALMDTSALVVAQPEARMSLRTLNHDVLERAPGMPHLANRQMAAGLQSKLGYMTSNGQSDLFETKRKISKMREYYGIPEPVTADGSAATKTNSDDLGEMTFD